MLKNADEMPTDDATFALVAGIIAVVPVSHWAFARVDPNGTLKLLHTSGSEAIGCRLPDEYERQRAKITNGPRIAASLGKFAAQESGITLLFADARTDYGVLTLLRGRELGPFLSTEIGVLTIALDAISEHLCELRLRPSVRFPLLRATRTNVTLRKEGSKQGPFVHNSGSAYRS